MTKPDSQSALILAYLRTGNSLTPLEALEKFQCWALSSRISELQKELGAQRQAEWIVSEMITLPNGKRIARYTLEAIAYG